MNRNYRLIILVSKLSVATKKTVLSTFTRRAQTQAFFIVSLYRLDTKKQVEQVFFKMLNYIDLQCGYFQPFL